MAPPDPLPNLGDLGGGKRIRVRGLGRGDAVLVLDEALPVAPLIPGRSDADALAHPLRPAEHRLRIATLLALFLDPDAAGLRELVGGRLIRRESPDDRQDQRIEPP